MGDYIFLFVFFISPVFSLRLILVVFFYTGFGLLFSRRPPFTAIYLYLIVSSISSCVMSLSLIGPLSWPSCTCQCHFLSRSITPFCVQYILLFEWLAVSFPLPSRPLGHQFPMLPSDDQITPQHPLLSLKDFFALMQQTLISMPMQQGHAHFRRNRNGLRFAI